MVNARASEGQHPDEVSRTHDEIRRWILDGQLKAGAKLSQVELAKRLGVSRGPLREALRLLQNDGLVSQRSQHRPQVTELSPGDLDQLCAMRMLLGHHAVYLATPTQLPETLDEAGLLLDEMLSSLTAGDLDHWQELDDHLLQLLASGSGPRLEAELARLSAHAARYRRAFLVHNPSERAAGARRYREVLDKARQRDAVGAARLFAEHLSRTALLLISEISPDYEPVHINQAFASVSGAGAEGDRADENC